MDEQTLRAIIEATPDAWLYASVCGLTLVQNLFIWIPGDIVGISAALLVATGKLDLIPAVLAVSFGGWWAIIFYYEISRRFGMLSRCSFLARFVGNRSVSKAADYLRLYGFWVVLAHRFIPGLRTWIVIAAGFSKISRRRFWALSLVSTVCWNAAIMGFAAGLFEIGWAGSIAALGDVPITLWVIVFAGIATAILWKFHWGPAKWMAGRKGLDLAGSGDEIAYGAYEAYEEDNWNPLQGGAEQGGCGGMPYLGTPGTLEIGSPPLWGAWGWGTESEPYLNSLSKGREGA